MKLPVRRLPHGADLPLPRYETAGAAGMDLMAAVAADLVLQPGARAIVPTGLQIAVPPGHEGQVRPRSGLAAKHGVTVLNAPGTIDCDYRGEVGVILVNLGSEPFTVTSRVAVRRMCSSGEDQRSTSSTAVSIRPGTSSISNCF